MRLSISLLHYPVVDRFNELYTTAITNMDVHDIARSACTYNLDQYYVVSPILAQREMAVTMASFWVTGSGNKRNADRARAMSLVSVQENLQACVDHEELLTKSKPVIIATSAKPCPKTISYKEGQKIIGNSKSTMVLCGTGYGLAPEIIDLADYVLEPIYGATDYNHLSVRSAAAIILDRLCAQR